MEIIISGRINCEAKSVVYYFVSFLEMDLEMNNDWLAVRIVHLKGGARAVNEKGPSVKLYPTATNNKQAEFKINSYHQLFSGLEQIKIPVIGVDFYTYPYQLDGRDIPEWRPFYKDEKSIWGNEEGARLWSNISTGAHKIRNGRLWDLSSRVSHQLRVCAWRLRQASAAYEAQLNARIKKNDFEVGNRFCDGFTWLCYMSIQSFLVDACIIRDYLAEYASHFVFGPMLDDAVTNITTMSGLRKKVLNRIDIDDPLLAEILSITSSEGWLKELGSYRDLVVHSAPIAQAEKRLFAICDALPIDETGSIPAIRCPIPENPSLISSYRAKGSLFEDFEVQFKLFVKAMENDAPQKDCLDYCYTSLGKLSNLANKLASRTPVKPEMMVFDESNIIGDIKVEMIES